MKISFICKWNKDKMDYVIEDPREWDGVVDNDMSYPERGFWYKIVEPIEQNGYRYYIDCIDVTKDGPGPNLLDEVISRAIQMLRDKRIKEILE